LGGKVEPEEKYIYRVRYDTRTIEPIRIMSREGNRINLDTTENEVGGDWFAWTMEEAEAKLAEWGENGNS
jgi:hypothetical protein